LGHRDSCSNKNFKFGSRGYVCVDLIRKCNQPIAYALRVFNKTEHNYTTTKKEALTMAYALHKYRHYLLGNKFIFYVDHMTLLYLVREPQVSKRIKQWLLLFLECFFSNL
jgi:hypothetical protein